MEAAPTSKLKGQREEVVSGIQGPGSPIRSWSHGGLPRGWESHGGDVSTVSDIAKGREKEEHSGFPLPPALPVPIAVKMSEGRGQHPGMWNRAGQAQQMVLSANRPKSNTIDKAKDMPQNSGLCDIIIAKYRHI